MIVECAKNSSARCSPKIKASPLLVLLSIRTRTLFHKWACCRICCHVNVAEGERKQHGTIIISPCIFLTALSVRTRWAHRPQSAQWSSLGFGWLLLFLMSCQQDTLRWPTFGELRLWFFFRVLVFINMHTHTFTQTLDTHTKNVSLNRVTPQHGPSARLRCPHFQRPRRQHFFGPPQTTIKLLVWRMFVCVANKRLYVACTQRIVN